MRGRRTLRHGLAGIGMTAVMAAVLAVLGAPDAHAGARKAARQALAAEMAELEQAVADTTALRGFCDRELASVSRRVLKLKEASTSVEDPLDPTEALARLAVLREELESEVARCRGAAQARAEQALGRLQAAVRSARERGSEGTGQSSGAPSAVVMECDDLVGQVLPAMIGGGRFTEAIATARDAVRRLELDLTGTSCEDELGAAERQLSLGAHDAAVDAFCRLASGSCLEARWSEQADQRLSQLAVAVEATIEAGTKGGGPAGGVSMALDSDDAVAVAGALARCRPDRWGELSVRATAPLDDPLGRAPGDHVDAAPPEEDDQPPIGPDAGQRAPVERVEHPEEESGIDTPAAIPSTVQGSSERRSYLALDVWQSAWGDFADIGDLVDYLRRNHIREINLNPGQGMSPKLEREGYEHLAPLVDGLRRSGVELIAYLYAELNYDIGAYAAFLKKHPDLGIRTIVDDSEFTDRHLPRFERNRDRVREYGLRYAAFVTVEARGNSGVSDATRRWAVANLDEVIFMSYLSCSLEGQKADLDHYLDLADRLGKRGAVKIAILFGGKKVGRERSCETELDEAGMQAFLEELHTWARTHPSYGGIVLETNRRLPGYDVARRPLR